MERNAPDWGGYVKLWRKAKDSEPFADPHLWQLFCWLKLSAAHQLQTVSVKTGRGRTTVKLQPGQLIFGRNVVAERLNVPPSTLWDRMKRLEQLDCILIKSDSHFSIVTICNWRLYQSGLNDDRQPTGKQPTGKRQPTDTYKKAKNSKNGKNAEKRFDLKEISLEEIADDARRIARKLKPTDDGGRELIIKACIIAHRELSEDWLSRAVSAVTESQTAKGNLIGDFRVCLRDKAEIDGKDFEALFRSIPRIPREWLNIFDRLDDAA